ncbi:magnesium or manganese-dependent protein phosphatase [Deinococcus grandis]|uniref:Magnesium or manganese-dependent protein phosphatase n=1 Tax=Deinococcus grandis TaxID=57498 RepID=A0A100HPN3_9DEIO|nr:hypothetical protein DEGR_33900 [Deinococcus grandis]GAQ23375.1 magnesium or manganese-dependent protein phosphatase [Deinococcus grandis]
MKLIRKELTIGHAQKVAKISRYGRMNRYGARGTRGRRRGAGLGTVVMGSSLEQVGAGFAVAGCGGALPALEAAKRTEGGENLRAARQRAVARTGLIRIPFVSLTIRNFTGLPAPRPETALLLLASARVERFCKPFNRSPYYFATGRPVAALIFFAASFRASWAVLYLPLM